VAKGFFLLFTVYIQCSWPTWKTDQVYQSYSSSAQDSKYFWRNSDVSSLIYKITAILYQL